MATLTPTLAPYGRCKSAYRCATCDFDACAKCVKAARKNAPAEPRAPAGLASVELQPGAATASQDVELTIRDDASDGARSAGDRTKACGECTSCTRATLAFVFYVVKAIIM